MEIKEVEKDFDSLESKTLIERYSFIFYTLRRLTQLKTKDDQISSMINKQLFEKVPHVGSSISKSTLHNWDIQCLLRKRISFFGLYNLFDWQEQADADIKMLLNIIERLDIVSCEEKSRFERQIIRIQEDYQTIRC